MMTDDDKVIKQDDYTEEQMCELTDICARYGFNAPVGHEDFGDGSELSSGAFVYYPSCYILEVAYADESAAVDELNIPLFVDDVMEYLRTIRHVAPNVDWFETHENIGGKMRFTFHYRTSTDNRFYPEKMWLRPTRATPGSAGYDFVAPKDFIVPAHGVSETIDTGVTVYLKSGFVLMCYARSSFGFKHGVTLANGTGIIDSDFFPNTIKCKLRNDSDEDFAIRRGDKFMQGIFMNYSIENGEDTSRMTLRKGGIGSTDE